MLIGDAWFKQHPDKVLGTPTLKKRGDRGADAVEEIVQGNLSDALNSLSSHIGDWWIMPSSIKQRYGTAIERLRLKNLSLKMELDLLELEL